MLAHVYYLRDGTLLIPMVANTTDGFQMECAPVEVLHPSTMESLARALERVLDRGNPLVPSPARQDFPKPVVLEHAKARSWKAFERKARLLRLFWRDDGVTVVPTQHVPPDRGWQDDDVSAVFVPGRRSFEQVAEQIASVIVNAN